jgi:hypothetical protein
MIYASMQMTLRLIGKTCIGLTGCSQSEITIAVSIVGAAPRKSYHD